MEADQTKAVLLDRGARYGKLSDLSGIDQARQSREPEQ